MQPNWEDIRIFLAYLRNGSVKATSSELKVSGPTVSRRLESLQRCIGHPLYRRKPEGIELLPSTRSLVAMWEEAETLLTNAPYVPTSEGHFPIVDLRFSTTPALASALIFPNLCRYQADWPNVHVEIDTSFHVRDLSAGESDVALRLIEPTAGNIIRQKLTEIRFGVFAAAHKVPDSFVPAQSWEDLQTMNLPAITWAQSAAVSMPQERLRQALGDHQVGITISDFTSLMDGLLNGLGIGVLPEVLGNKICGLRQLSSPDLVGNMPLWMVTSQRMAQYPHILAFRKFLRAVVTEQSDQTSENSAFSARR